MNRSDNFNRADSAVSLGVASDGLGAWTAAVADVQVTTNKLDDTLENNAGTYRFTEAALAEAPAGSGGGGGTDWTADERTAIRAVLGIPSSGSVPGDPSAGILDAIRDAVATRASQSSVDDIAAAIDENPGGGGMTVDTVLLTVTTPSARLVDPDANQLTQLTVGQALTAILSATVGDRSGVGTSEISAGVPGVEGASVTARRVSRSVIENTTVVPTAG